MDEAEDIAGFIPKLMNNIPEGYLLKTISVGTETKKIKLYYTSSNNQKTVAILQEKTSEQFIPDSSAIIGIVNNSTAEIMSPIKNSEGTMINGGSYGGMTDISSIRWQENGFEYTVIGNVSFDELSLFAKSLSEGVVLIPMDENETSNKPEIEVPFDLEVEENSQISVDAGHSPWRLDPAFVTQVFVSLLISPEGIQGDYPIQYEDITIIQNNGDAAIAQISGETTPASKVYLKRLIRQDSTGIWTVVGYDPVKK
jgi:hypothetical protein